MAFRWKGMKGGNCVSEDHTSLLRFSLEESVWFQRGQEVEELYSISLEPNVSAHQVEQYVILKGTLDLMGEYKAAETTELEVGAEDPFRRYVSVIEQREHQLFEFHQQFPVDITIPADRVREMEELNIGVHTFDYKLPEKGTLQITADLWIGGVYENLPDEQNQVVETEEREETSNYQNNTSSQLQEDHQTHAWNTINEEVEEESAEEIPIQAEVTDHYEDEEVEVPLYRVNSDVEDQEADDVEESPELYLKNPIPYIESNHIQEDHFYVETKLSPRPNQATAYEETESMDESEHRDEQNYSPFGFEPDQLVNRADQEEDKNQSFSIPYDNKYDEGPPELMEVLPFTVEAEIEESSEYDRVQQQQSQINTAPVSNETVVEPESIASYVRQQKKEQTSNQYVEKKYHSSEAKRENGNEEQKEGKSKSLLYDLFTEEEESQQSKVRVCIVQNGENIDVLAERYKTSVQHIARINGLELTSDLKAGQVIYIPEAAASYK